MKKIMFNDKYCLTQSVLEGRKTQTRRMLNPTMFFQKLETYEGWSNEDIRAWKRSCNRRLHEAQGDTLQQMLDYALSSSRYKLDEVVAVAQKYKNIALDMSVELAAELIKQPGGITRCLSRQTLCRTASVSPTSVLNVCKTSAMRM